MLFYAVGQIAHIHQSVQGHHHRIHVAGLELASQLAVKLSQMLCLVVDIFVMMFCRNNLMLVLCIINRCLHLLGQRVEDGSCLGFCFADDDGNAFLDDATLFKGNLLQAVAQQLGVVERDVGDDADDWGDDVCAVQSATQSYLYNGDVHISLLEVFKRHCGGELKERRVEGFVELLFIFHKLHHIVFLDRCAVDAYALAEVNKVG